MMNALRPASPHPSNEAEHSYLVSSLESAVKVLQDSCPQLSRTFLIGGAQLYAQAMQATPKTAVLERLLITRIYEPGFEECDVFLPEFRRDWQIEQEEKEGNQQGDCQWRHCTESELDDFVEEETEKGVIEEKGVRYRLQMWSRAS